MEDTGDLLSKLNNASDINSLDDYLNAIDGCYTLEFHRYLNAIMIERGIEATELINKSKIERTYVYQLLNGRRKPGRDKVVTIALALGLSLEETQRLLGLAKENILYAKSPRDSILIYAINHKCSIMDTNDMLIKHKEEELR